MSTPPHDVPPVEPLTGSTPASGAALVPDSVGERERHLTQHMDIAAMAFVFVLATFIGVGVIRRVSRLLHTPLMSLTNAISAIAVVGAIIVAGDARYPTFVRVLGAIALFASMTNIISGFLITQRMLRMFRTRKSAEGTAKESSGGASGASGGAP